MDMKKNPCIYKLATSVIVCDNDRITSTYWLRQSPFTARGGGFLPARNDGANLSLDLSTAECHMHSRLTRLVVRIASTSNSQLIYSNECDMQFV
jgi:hypothetical protein